MMITFFSCPKPFRGHIAVIQRNAIRSWMLLRPRPDIVLVGDDEGTSEVAREFGVRYIPEVARNAYGTPLVNSLFELAQKTGSHRLLAYVNTDIILKSDFLPAISRIPWSRFLMLGQRWDLDVTRPLDFDDPDWEAKLWAEVHTRGSLHPHTGVDYYVFPMGLWGEIPPFAVGRTSYDNWLVWRARSLGVPVIDATRMVTSIHQNHDRTYTSVGVQPLEATDDLTKGVESRINRELAGGWEHTFTLEDATHVLTVAGVKRVLTLRRLARHLERLPAVSPSLGPLLWPSKMWLLGRRLARAVAWRVRRLVRGTRPCRG